MSRFLRSGIFKISFLVLLLILLSAAAFVIALPWFLSTDAIRIRLAQDLSTWTGYSVQLRQPPQISFFPRPKAVLAGVSLRSSSEHSALLMQADHVEFDLSLLAVLRGQVSISETRIIAPKFTLNEPVKNVNDALQTLAGSQGALGVAIRETQASIKEKPQNPDLKHLSGQPFGRIIVEDGIIDYSCAEGGARETISQVHATLDWLALGRKASLVISGMWHGEKTELRLDADQALLLFSHATSPIYFSLNSLRGGVTFNGQAKFDNRFFLDGQLSGRSPGWDQTLKWLGLDHSLSIGIKEPVVWESSLNAIPERIELNNVDFSLGADSARGALEINWLGDTPMITGSLAFQTLNLNTLLAAYFPDEKDDNALDLEGLEYFNFDVRLSAPQAQFASLTFMNMAAAVQIRNGRAILDLGNVNAFGGMLQSNVQVFNDKGTARVEARIAGSGVESADILKALHYPPVFAAKSNFTLTLQAPFTRWSKLASHMQGSFSLESTNGRFAGYDFSAFETRFMQENPVILPKKEDHFSAFNRLVAKGTVSDASAFIKDGLMIKDDQKLTFSGLVPLEGKNRMESFVDLVSNHAFDAHDIVFNISQVPLNSSTTVCADVECLQNSLMPPQLFFLSGNADQLTITTTVEKAGQE